MYLLDFMNSHENWEELLAAAPYSIDIRHDEPYVLLKYNQLLSDFSLPEVQGARGSIFRREGNIWICVARSLDKFHNYSENYAATPRIDWSKGVDIQEKVDGSICRLWYDRNDWHLSTNGTINAFTAECGDTTFGDVFVSIVERYMNSSFFFSLLHKDYTYWFELVSPTHNHIVVRYPEDRIYYLGCRNMTTMEEEIIDKPAPFLWEPAHFTYHSLAECVEAAHNLGENEEGYVCVSSSMENGSFLRVKVKGDAYLTLHHLRGNGPLTVRRLVEYWQQDILDDFCALCPEYADYIYRFGCALTNLATELTNAYEACAHIEDRRQYAKVAFTYPSVVRAYLFARKDNKFETAIDFMKDMRVAALADVLNMED